MTSTDSAQRFINEINQQLIFQTFLESLSIDDQSKLISQNKLICRNNLDLFFANENLVRCCTVNPDYNNFRLLDNKYDNFKIRSLEMNSLGSLLAIVGDTDLVVVTLPVSLTASNNSLLPVKSYKIQGIGGNIKKVIWQSVISNDCCLVVLDDKSVIRSYDLSLSYYEPQLSINLNDHGNFKSESASAITFGSNTNLTGGLTLYVSTLNSNVFAVYPFIHKLGKIATTEPNVRDLLDESTILINTIEENFPSKDLIQSCKKSILKRASTRQYAYALALYKQLESSVRPRNEYRNLTSENPLELCILNQELPDGLKATLQGPIATNEGAINKDIICINSNNNISILASISVSDSKECVVSYLSQLKPLIMKQDDDEPDSGPILLEKPKIEAKKPEGYVKPTRGFGFIDATELEEEQEQPEIGKEEFEEKIQGAELYFWKNEFNELNTLALDKIPIESTNDDVLLSRLNSEESKISIKIDNNILIYDCSSWSNDLVSNISNGHKPEKLNISGEYDLVVEGTEEISSFALIKDTVTETGEFLIVLKKNQEENLEIKQVSENNTSHVSKFNTEDDSIYKEKILHESVLSKEPFEEISRELENLKRVDPKYLEEQLSMGKDLFGKPVYGTDTTILKNLNLLSTETIQQVSKLTAFAIHLNLRVITQVNELKIQIESLREVQNNNLKDDALNSKKEKATGLIERQDKINNRIQSLQDKIFSSIQKIKYSKSLPLSDAERSWFKEINAINAQISLDTSENKSLNSVVENLRLQVSQLRKPIKGENDEEEAQSLEDKLQHLQLHKHAIKLKQWLHDENELISLAKEKLEGSFKQLNIIS